MTDEKPLSIVVFDLETTGLFEDSKSRVTEVAMARWLPEKRRIVEATSFLLQPTTDDFEIGKHITALTGLTTTMVKMYGYGQEAFGSIFEMLKSGDACMARNGVGFDWPMLCREALHAGMTLPDVTLIDDYLDIDYPPEIKGRSQDHVAADHGFLNPFSHTALGDVMTLITIMERGKYNMHAALESAKSPAVWVKADVHFKNKDLAKERGFHWHADESIWRKRMRKKTLEYSEFPFPIEVIGL